MFNPSPGKHNNSTCVHTQHYKGNNIHHIHSMQIPQMPRVARHNSKLEAALQKNTVENVAKLTLTLSLKRFTLQTPALHVTTVLHRSFRTWSCYCAVNTRITFRSRIFRQHTGLSAPEPD